MDEEYDVIVLGTGLKECILSGLLSVAGRKVLHMDRNDYYGGESASLSLNQLWERFRPGQPLPKELGASRDYNVDMVPKFMMANGKLVRTLILTDVTKYLDFKGVDGSYVLNGGKVYKVPITGGEALRSSLIGMFEKISARNFFTYCQEWDEKDPSTHKHGYDLFTMPMAALFKEYKLGPQIAEFVGHAIALHRDDGYLQEPAVHTVRRMQLYNGSLHRYEGLTSPYIYPKYGLGELPQGFARLSAVYGGVYMLSKKDAKVEFDSNGVAIGVSADGVTAKAKLVVGDPSYFPNKVKKTSQVVRALCIMSHPIPNTDNAHSCQIILPAGQLGRRSDMYVFCCSYAHNVAPTGKWLAFVSTTVETANPESELAPGLALLGPVDQKFVAVSDVFAPLEDGSRDKCYISSGYDATTHFETTVDDVLALYQRITGQQLDLDAPPPSAGQRQ